MNANWFKKYWKYITVIILYFLYQTNFILVLIEEFNIHIDKLSKSMRITTYTICDLLYVIILILMFLKEIKKGLKDLKENFLNRATLSLECWVLGSIIMTISSIILSHVLKQDVSANEKLVRESIKLAPIYMLFTCSLVAPLFEEMLFRRSLKGFINNKWVFIILSGTLFGLLHVIGSYKSLLDFLYVIPYGAMGSCFAYLYNKTNNITLPIIVHMMHNTILVLSQIIGG